MSEVTTISGRKATMLSSTTAVTLSPVLVPITNWPKRRPSSGANTGWPKIDIAAVTTSGPSVQASGTCSQAASAPTTMDMARLMKARGGGSRNRPGEGFAAAASDRRSRRHALRGVAPQQLDQPVGVVQSLHAEYRLDRARRAAPRAANGASAC